MDDPRVARLREFFETLSPATLALSFGALALLRLL